MIVVVGGGITGLATGWELAGLGADVLVLEGGARTGGVIRSAEVEGRVLDWGPQRTRLTPGVSRVVEALGLGSELLLAPEGLGLSVFRDGRLRAVPFDPVSFVRTDLLSLGGKARLLLEPFTAGADSAERVSDYFRRKVGDELYEVLIAPLYGGLYASDPADMEVGLSLAHVLRELGVGRSLLLTLLRRGARIAPPAPCSFRTGMQALPDALARDLGPRLRRHAPVERIARRGSGWIVVLAGGEEVEASQVVLATPAPEAAGILRGEAPAVAAMLERLRYNPLAVVHLESEAGLQGMGFQVSFTERALLLRGVTFNEALFGRDRLYTAYLGGALHPEVRTLPVEALAERAVQEFRLTTGHEARPLRVEHEAVPAWDVTWRAIQGISPPEGVVLAGNWWSRPGLPGRLAEARRIAAHLTGSAGPGAPPARN